MKILLTFYERLPGIDDIINLSYKGSRFKVREPCLRQAAMKIERFESRDFGKRFEPGTLNREPNKWRLSKISSVIIDGYNLIGIYHNDLSKQREKIVNLLIGYRKIKGHDITVVFDGWKSGSHKEESFGTGGIKVIYSRLGEKADYVIKKIISREKREWIVISSDREIMAHAWACGSVPVPSERFWSIIENAGRSFDGEYELLEEDDYAEHKKGNPRQLSRKEKALMRALRKL